jgi:hypothetical protein
METIVKEKIENLTKEEKDRLVEEIIREQEHKNALKKHLERRSTFKPNNLDARKLKGLNKLIYDNLKDSEEKLKSHFSDNEHSSGDEYKLAEIDFNLKHLHINKGDIYYYHEFSEGRVYQVEVKKVNIDLDDGTLNLVLQNPDLNDGKCYDFSFADEFYSSDSLLLNDKDLIEYVHTSSHKIRRDDLPF